ncbi:MAG: hypothetical protein LBT00_12525 [Spirochaetaceae bacterium]|nr:hypothetical protein [Spirochaetaceae bacterium]
MDNGVIARWRQVAVSDEAIQKRQFPAGLPRFARNDGRGSAGREWKMVSLRGAKRRSNPEKAVSCRIAALRSQ